jgi:hypothetical protein
MYPQSAGAHVGPSAWEVNPMGGNSHTQWSSVLCWIFFAHSPVSLLSIYISSTFHCYLFIFHLLFYVFYLHSQFTLVC